MNLLKKVTKFLVSHKGILMVVGGAATTLAGAKIAMEQSYEKGKIEGQDSAIYEYSKKLFEEDDAVDAEYDEIVPIDDSDIEVKERDEFI